MMMNRFFSLCGAVALSLSVGACTNSLTDTAPSEPVYNSASAGSVEDTANNRLLLLSGDPGHSFAFAQAVSCVGSAGVTMPVLSDRGASCAQGTSAERRFYYVPLSRNLSDSSPADILGAKSVEIAIAAKGASTSCGLRGADFDAMLDRLADDLGDGTLAPSPGRVPVLIAYAGGGALGWVRGDLIPDEVRATGRYSLEFDDGGSSAKCSCSSGSNGCSGPNDGPNGTQNCTAGECTSCKISG